VKAVAANAGIMEIGRDREALRHGGIRRMEGRVEAGHLRQLGTTREQHPDRRQVMRLMQRRQGNKSLQCRQHVAIDPHRPREIRPAVHHAMPDRLEFHPRGFTPKEVRKVVDRALVTELDTLAPALFRGDDASSRARDEMRRSVNALDLSPQLRIELAVPVLVEQELDARRAGVQDQNALAGHDTAFSNCTRREWAISTATAQEA
jgi:hypothetical protein